ncbi:MAG: hypothetical protein JWL69_2440 [Phycisphaerales bacterium]|nr:hypothetical protein [Phycisphaerales bacterium]
MNLLVLTLLSLLGGGGGNDLLDYVPTDVYWNARHVVVSVDAMASELKPVTDQDIAHWIADLDSADPQSREAAYWKLLDSGPTALPKLKKIADSTTPEPAQRAAALIAQIDATPKCEAVRRLMAIRALGELKKPEAIPVLREFLDSKEMFVADYARTAIAQIEGKPAERARAAGTDRDVWLFPSECRAIAHVEFRIGRPIDYAAVFKQFPLPNEQDLQATIDFIANQALSAAEAVGNVRLDALTIGISGNASENGGYAIVIAAGQYDAAALDQFARKLKIVFKTVGGQDIFQPDPDTSAYLASNNRLVLLARPKNQDGPLADMIAAMKSGEGKLKTVPEMVNLLGKVDVNQPIWAAMKVTDAYRKLSMLAAFDEVTLVGHRDGAGMRLTVRGTGPDPAKVKSAADLATSAIAQSAKEIRQMASTSPALRIIADLLDGAKVAADGNGASITVDVPELPAVSTPGQKDTPASKE